MFEALLKTTHEAPPKYPELWEAIHSKNLDEIGVELTNLVRRTNLTPHLTLAGLGRLRAVFNAVQQYRLDQNRNRIVRWLRAGAVNLAVDALLENLEREQGANVA